MRVFRTLALSMFSTALLASAAVAGDAPQAAGSGAVGNAITVKKATKIDQLAKRPERYVGKTVRIEGRVKAVCQSTGCWAEVEDAKGVTFLAKSLDESVLLPMGCAGSTVVVQGVVTRLDPKAHDHEHAEKDHVCPRPTFVVSTQGAQVK